MSRPTINRPESIEKIQNEDVKTVRSSSLRPVYDYIKSDASIFCKLIGDIRVDKINYKPSTDIKPILLADRKQINPNTFRETHHLTNKPIIALLPGSRKQEITKMLAKAKHVFGWVMLSQDGLYLELKKSSIRQGMKDSPMSYDINQFDLRTDGNLCIN